MSRRRGPHTKRIIRYITVEVDGETWTTSYRLDCGHLQALRRRVRGTSRGTRSYATCWTCANREPSGKLDGRQEILDVRFLVRSACRDPELFDALQWFCATAVDFVRNEKPGPWSKDLRERMEKFAGKAGLLAPQAALDAESDSA